MLLFALVPFFLLQGISAATWERRSPWIPVAKIIAGLAKKTDSIIVMPPHNLRDLGFYLHAMGDPKSRLELSGGHKSEERLKNKIREMVETRRVVWLVSKKRPGRKRVDLNDIPTSEMRICVIQEGRISITAFYSLRSQAVVHQHCGNRQ